MIRPRPTPQLLEPEALADPEADDIAVERHHVMLVAQQLLGDGWRPVPLQRGALTREGLSRCGARIKDDVWAAMVKLAGIMCEVSASEASLLRNGCDDDDRGKRVEKWLWWIRDRGRTTVTSRHFTEEEIRRAHPNAIRVESTRVVLNVPEDKSDLEAAPRQRGDR